MPAPAVIPAPRAYINAVAVKGFVVELGAAKWTTKSHLASMGSVTVALVAREHSETKTTGLKQLILLRCILPNNFTHATHAFGGTPVILL